MADSVYNVVEVVGTSHESISKAIGRAIDKAGTTLRHLGWFEVAQIRGAIENGRIKQYQVRSRLGLPWKKTDTSCHHDRLPAKPSPSLCAVFILPIGASHPTSRV
jgi:flavin-binding protein dodecin